MTTNSTSFLQKTALLFLIIFGLYIAKDFLIPLCIGGILATLFLPFCNWMESKKTPKSIAVFICFISLLLILFSLISLVGWKISELLNDISLIKQKAIETGTTLQRYIFNHLDISIEEQFLILKKEQPSYSNIFQIIFGSITSIFASFVLVFVYFIFLLFYRNHIKNFLLKLATPSKRDEMELVIFNATKVSQQYLVGLSKMIVLLWIMYSIGFSIIGVKNAFFFAILCGLLEIVPYVGNITGTILTVTVAAIHGANPSLLGGIIITYSIVQLIQGWVLEPLILGPQVKINPLFTIIVLVIGQLLWGIPGIILAIPLTAIFKIICDHIDFLKPYGFLIGEIETSKKKSVFVEKLKTKLKIK
ncbi:MAG: AI-2E family transporter [Flavobacterium sp.]|uniref:AI-2E family transporter n=1 Tax=Flavobacterium sp. TaxID=239 RepID=UPI0022CBCD90|nr:AI-2E family transporter [Flavobacterium sp.]MCZ8196303.1 AI-2E family transporter [Flavobacterium sp.]